MKPVLNFLYTTFESLLLQSVYGFLIWVSVTGKHLRLLDLKLLLHNFVNLVLYAFYFWLLLIILYSVLFRKGLSGKMLLKKSIFAICISFLVTFITKSIALYEANSMISFMAILLSSLTLIVLHDKKLRTLPLSKLIDSL